MAEFTDILRESPYRALHSCIDSFPTSGLQAELAEFRRKEPNVALAPLLSYCIQEGRMAPFEELLDRGIVPDDGVVEAAADIGNDRFLLRLLGSSWPINNNLRGGKVPSVLW